MGAVVWYGFRIKAILISLVIGLICLFGGQWLYNKYGYQQSLQQVLERQPQVAEFKTEEQGDRLAIKVRLKSAGNLMVTYQQLEGALDNALGKRSFVLELMDNRDASLEEAYYRSQFALYQALAQGSFEEMEAEINRQAGAVGATARVYIDGDNVYLALIKGDRFLAKVIPRNPPQEVTGGVGPYA
ncbi:MAG: hypothetical protein AB1500_09265 [Bacillota bacterium]